MLSYSVEAHYLGQQHIVQQCLVVWGRCSRLRPVTLIQHEPQNDRPAVQDELVALHIYRTQCGVAMHFINHLAVFIAQLDTGVDQRRRTRAPQQIVAVVIDARI